MLSHPSRWTEEQPLPPLTPMEAEVIVRRAEPAFRAHRAWVRNVYASLICRLAPSQEQINENRRLLSVVTRWFLCETDDNIRRHPLHGVLVRDHREINEAAEALLDIVRGNGEISPDQFQAFAGVLDRFNRAFEDILGEMWCLLRTADPLTGVSTRFAMLSRLEQERDRVHRTGESCSICMADLDHFKQINDTHGHPVGDTVLQHVSCHMLRNLRPYDQIYRYGGEEFLLMLPNTRLEAAVPIIDRLRQRISNSLIRVTRGISIRATASFGIAALHPDWSAHEAIGMADKALYAAKAAGRNRIRVWSLDKACAV